MPCQGIALYFEYLCLLSRCCAFLCKTAFPCGLMTGPLMQKNAGCIPSPVNPVLSAVSLPHPGTSWLVSLQTLRSTADPSVCSCRALDTVVPKCTPLASLPGLAGAFVEERKYTQSPSGLPLNVLSENQLLATWFCMVPGRVFLCNSSGLKLRVSHTLWPSCSLQHGDADLDVESETFVLNAD